MPLLSIEPDLYPHGLLADEKPEEANGRAWRVIHTRPRQEKCLARYLYARQVPFYLPVIPRRWRSRGRTVTSYLPLFAGYLFLLGRREECLATLGMRRAVRALDVPDQEQLWNDLRQVNRLISSGQPITPVGQLVPGATVEIRSGPLAGLRGKILRAASGQRFVVQVDFIQQGASILLDDFALTMATD